MTTRVLQLLLAPAIGGAETLAHGLENGLHQHGLEVVTAYLDPAGTSSAPLARLRRLRRLLRDVRPDVVLSHSALPNVYSRVVAGRRVPVVVVLHSASRDFDDRVLRSAERALRRRTAGVVAVAPGQAVEYVAAFGRRHEPRLVPNGVPTRYGDLVRSRPGGPEVRVVTLARINQQKDPETWRGAALTVVAARSRVSFAWSGPASGDPVQHALVADSGHPAVAWAGPTDDAAAVLAAADIYFHAARAEAHPLAVLEAAAAGVPVVCSEAVAAALPPGLPAAVFRTSDASSAADALLQVVDGLEEAQRHAATWRAEVLCSYGMDRVLSDYASLIHEAAGLRR